MTIIDDNTVVVFSSTELKNVLENDNEYTYIYFGDNISLDSSTKIASHNYTEEELKSLPSIDNFIFANKKIFSVGDFLI